MKSPPFERELNDEQRAAVLAPDGPTLVLAAAGTGKTRTLVYRVVHLIQQGVPPGQILLLTFTNKAAREMLERAEAAVGAAVSGLWGGTFHHMANRILRRHAPLLGYSPAYTILDRDDAESVMKRILKEMKVDHLLFPKAEVLLTVISEAANSGDPVDDRLAARFQDLGETTLAQIGEAVRRYEKEKRDLQAMDFDDLLVNGLRLFREHPDVESCYQTQFRHVLVDEYQDTNPLQAEWVNRLAAAHRNLFVVGDDFQSIYGWRGADFRNILEFQAVYPDARLYKLETNYRSTPEILAVANACIAGNPRQFQKVLRSTRPSRRLPLAVCVRDGDAQARFIVAQIQRWRSQGVRPDEIAVLYRAHFHALELQIQLMREKIPFVITSGVRFFEQAHLKDVLAVLRLMQNPGDAIAFRRLIQQLPGVGPRTVDRLWERLDRRFPAVRREARQTLESLLPPKAIEEWRLMASGWEAVERGASPVEAIDLFVKTFYQRFAETHFTDPERRLEDIQETLRTMANYDSLDAFLGEVALMTNLEAEDEAVRRQQAGPCLRLSTVHQAKGLEWRVVIIPWAVEGLFPSARAMAEDPLGHEEERRLFYVAITRAKDELIFVVPETRRTRDGNTLFCRPSRFLEEIPEGLLEEVRMPFL
jgi:DNA helicase-2/ATP-dependent DNA helicase PcrA